MMSGMRIFRGTGLNVLVFSLVVVPLGHLTSGLAWVVLRARTGSPFPPLSAFVRELVDSLIIGVIPLFWLACLVVWVVCGRWVARMMADATRPMLVGIGIACTVALVAYAITIAIAVGMVFSRVDLTWSELYYTLGITFGANAGTIFWLLLQGALMHRYWRV